MVIIIEKEKKVWLHDIGFVNSSYFLPAISPGIVKSIFGHTTRGSLCDEFDALYDSIHNFMLDSWIFTFCVFTDGYHIHIIIQGLVSFNGFARSYIGIEVEFSNSSDKK